MLEEGNQNTRFKLTAVILYLPPSKRSLPGWSQDGLLINLPKSFENSSASQ